MSRRLAPIAWALCVAIAVVSAVLLALGPGDSCRATCSPVPAARRSSSSLTFGGVGALVAWRMPENRIGWIFCVIGVFGGASVLAWAYADYSLNVTSHPLPGADAAAAFPSEGLAPLLGIAMLVFPDGRLPSRRWRPVAVMLGLAMALLLVSDSVRPGALDDPFRAASNPLGVSGLREVTIAMNAVGWVLVPIGIVLAAASLIVRLRRAHGVVRRQLQLVLGVGALVAVVVALDMSTWLIWPDGNVQIQMAVIGLSFSAFPAATGVAILRYRLYDIDVVISRTVSYAVLVVVLAGLYFGGVYVAQAALRSVSGQSSTLAVTASTLLVAAAFQPLRRRIQQAVDRRFYRPRTTPRRRSRLRGAAAPAGRHRVLERLGARRGGQRDAASRARSAWLRSRPVTIPERRPVQRRCMR